MDTSSLSTLNTVNYSKKRILLMVRMITQLLDNKQSMKFSKKILKMDIVIEDSV